jgi:hypothetical protein
VLTFCPHAGLPPPLRQDWRLLFNSTKNGMSYSTFLGRLGEASPTLLLVRDKGGAVFGGIAHAPWQKTGTFYGECTRTQQQVRLCRSMCECMISVRMCMPAASSTATSVALPPTRRQKILLC